MSDMRDIILSAPEQIPHSLEVNKDVHVDGSFDSIILAGLGGSWHAGEIINTLGITTVPLTIHRTYGLPNYAYGKNPLVICSSYSGNTEEVVSAYEAAQEHGYGILVNTSGGKLEELATRDHVPIAKIDYPGMQPRHTTFASFVGVAQALINSKLAKDITSELNAATEFLQGMIPTLEEPAKALAGQIKGKIPVYLSSDPLAYAAWNFKIQTNENAKYPAYWNRLPEMNHNEMLGFSKLSETIGSEGNPPKFFVVMLRDKDDHPSIQARMDVTKGLYEGWGVTVHEIQLQGKNTLEKISYAIAYGLWTTYFLALEYGLDPVPVEGVESFKTKLAEITGADKV